MDTFIDSLRSEVSDGLSMNIAIERLHENDFTIIETMKFLVSEYEISLAEAKIEVSKNSVWSSVVESSRVMQDELVDQLKN